MNYLIIIFAILTLGVLATGMVVMVRGGAVNKKYSNKLMAARIWMQAITVALVILMLFLGAKH